MKKSTKRLFAVLLVLAMVVGLLPTIAFAESIGGEADPSKPVYVYTEEDNALIENDVFAKIEAVKAEAAQKMGGIEKMTEQDYVKLVPQVIKQIEASETYQPGTLQQNGNFLVWQTKVGIPCCYDPRMEAELHNNADAPSPEEAAKIEAEAEALVQHYETKGGTPTSTKIGLIQPYWESSSSYNDSSFLNYSPKYKTTWQNLYGATGGTGVRYSMSNATVDNIGSTLSQCGLVIFDSHGTTDYSGSNEDYTSRANSSYLCLITNSGVTSTDTAAHTGTYGTYYDCLKGSGYAYVNGQCIANHMSSNAPHSMLYMGICLGMATDRMCVPLRAKGVEVVYGYSQSVTFTGELQSIQSIMAYIQQDMQAGAAIEQSQTDLGCQWDPAYSSYSESQAVSNHAAFPVVASTEDTYPGHGNVDRVLTAYSTWHLFGEAYTVTATSNNTNYGTVSVDGYTITASPKTGYYAQGYTVVSGTATVTQNGNTFLVDPSSDCTIRINFAAKTAATVNYLANGSSVGTASGYVGDAITLRSTATDVDGWTFKGWVENTVAETATKPSFYAPGASYTIPAANTTLYALYTRFEEGSGETVYQLAEALEDGGKYIIVSQEGISGTTGYAVGNAAVTSSHYLNAVSVTINDEIASASSANLAKVVWQAASSGSKWTFYNQAAGKYMGLDSSEYIYPSSTALAWALTSEGYLDNEVDSEGYYYLSYDATNSRYTTSKQGKAINFYAETAAGTTYYSTSPVTVAHEHTMQYVAAVAPTCTVAGNSAYYRCTVCGKYYSDANGENEITQASTVIAALGHDYVATVTPPTETQQGYTTHVCSRCGDSYVDSYVPALGSDYPVHFSVPAGVTKPADMISNTNTGITLPTVEGPEGYTFLGWVVEDYDNVETCPTGILTGSYVAPYEITLIALFTYTDGEGTGETVYQLADAPEDGGEYVLVADESITGTTGYAVGNTAITSGHYLTPVAVTINSDDTCTVSSPASVLWKAAASGSGFTFYNEAAAMYMALDASQYLAPMSTGIAWVYTADKYLDNQIDTEGYYYLSYSAASTSVNYTRYTTGKLSDGSTANYVTHLYKAVTLGTAYYTTIIGEPVDYTVTFTTPAGVTAPAPMTINSIAGATLPTAENPEGYTFLGWVVQDYDNVTERPAQILTGIYKPKADITLKALYTYDVAGGTAPMLIEMTTSDTLADGDKIVITAAGTDVALYQQTVNTSYVNKYTFTNDVNDVLADAKNYLDVTAVSGGFYLGDDTNGYLYASSNNLYANTNKSVWTLQTRNGYLGLVTNNRYLSYRSDLTNMYWRMGGANAGTSGNTTLIIYKLTEGEASTAYYTTILPAAHEHTPAEPVIENNVDPTCTAAGSYDSVVYCAECGEELSRETISVPALGHDYTAVVTEPTCTEAGYTTYTCSRCGDTYVGDETAALGHDYVAEVTEPSCTEAGYTTYTCSRCGDSYTEEIAALGHLPGEPVQENYVEPTVGVEGGYDTVVYCQRCGEELSREHTVLPALPNPEPIETSNLRIFSSISVGTDMVVTWTARKTDVASYERFWIEVVKHGLDGDETYRYGAEQAEALNEGSTSWSCDFKHIFAKEMGVEIEARVYAEDASGQIYMSPAKTTNIRDYLGGRLTATNNTAEQRTLAADMLNYGAAAQLYMNYNTEHLVNEELTAEQLAKLDEYETKELPVVEKTNSNYRPEGQSNILFNSVSLDNEVILTLIVRAAEGADVKVLMKDHETGTVLETLDAAWNGSNYVVDYSGIGADKMRVAYDFVAQIDGAETGNTRTWSVEGYVGELRNGSNQTQINVANALLAYGDAAAAYFAE